MAVTEINNFQNNYAQYSNPSNKPQQAKRETAPKQEPVKKDIQNQDVSDYYKYLQKNYDAMKSGDVTISGEHLKKCAGDTQKAKELEDFIQKIPELEKRGYEELAARNKALGGTVTYYEQTWTINKDGSIQSTVYSVTETGMTNAERMKKNMDERLEKQKEKNAEEKKAEEKKVEDKKSETEELLYQSIKTDYVDAETIGELQEKMQTMGVIKA